MKMEKQLRLTTCIMLYLSCANVLRTENKFSCNCKLKEDLFRNIENKIAIKTKAMYYCIMKWQKRKAPGGFCFVFCNC